MLTREPITLSFFVKLPFKILKKSNTIDIFDIIFGAESKNHSIFCFDRISLRLKNNGDGVKRILKSDSAPKIVGYGILTNIQGGSKAPSKKPQNL